MFAYILFKLLKLNVNLFVFLFLSILPDITWPFYENHRKTSWWHTPLSFIWVLLWPQYAIAVASHFLLDLTYIFRLTPWSRNYVGFNWDTDTGGRISTKVPLLKRVLLHAYKNYFSKWYYLLFETVLFLITLYFIFH